MRGAIHQFIERQARRWIPNRQPHPWPTAYGRFREAGLYCRRRVDLPRDAAAARRLLAPVARSLSGRVYLDDGRAIIAWLEQFWFFELAAPVGFEHFGWGVIGATQRSQVLALLTQSIFSSERRVTVDLVVAPTLGLFRSLPAVPDVPGVQVSVRPCGVHLTWGQSLEEFRPASIVELVVTAESWTAPLAAQAHEPRWPVAPSIVRRPYGGVSMARPFGVDPQLADLEEGRDLPDGRVDRGD